MSSQTMVAEQAADLADAPEQLIELTQNEIYALPLEEQHRLQLAGVAKRFAELVERIPVLARLAEEQGITQIKRIEDLAPLLIPHSAMKSYPMSFLEQSRFDRLTQWLDGFTVHDLSVVPAKDCQSIDDWLDALDAHSDVRVIHSTGTSGKLSFLPRGTTEMHKMVTGYRRQLDPFRDEPSYLPVAPPEAPVIFMQYRHGAMAHHRLLDFLRDDLFCGDENMVIATNPTRFSADAASIGGRLRVAEAKGELGKIQISPTLIARRDAFLAQQQKTPDYFDAFFAQCEAHWKGRPVSLIGHIPYLHNVALEAKKRGITNLFSPESFCAAGGGLKGHSLPDNWRETIDDFTGGVPLVEGYGMTEVVAGTRICPGDHYHLPAWHVPFLLDPKTGTPLPRTGTRTGRYGTFDLNAQTYWGGFLTGDEITLSWGDDAPCSCGRIGPYMHRGIRRYTEKEGGDDKITCAGAPAAHDNAIDFLLNTIG